MSILPTLPISRKIVALNCRVLTNTFDLNRGIPNNFPGEFLTSHLQSARPRTKSGPPKLFQRKEKNMKSWIATLVLLSAAAGAMAQTPTAPAPTPTKPRLTLTTDAFEDGGIIPNKFTMAAEGTPYLRS
jgi:hypothetical protein